MKVLIPTSIDIRGLVNQLNLSKTCSENLKFKMYYFLSCVVIHNENYELYESNNGYRNICSTMMKKIIGNRYYYVILELLTNPDDPIIESNQSWYNPASAKIKGYCKGYRLTENYNNGEVVFKTLPHKFKRYHLDGPEDPEMNDKYMFLLNQFNNHQISFDPAVYEHIKQIGIALLNRVQERNTYQIKLIHNIIGRLLDYIHRIEQNKIWKQVSPENHRLNSSITGLPKILRPFILCNGQPLGIG